MAKRALDFKLSSPTKTRPTPTPPLSPKDITLPNPTATISGMIASVSPVGPNKYFDGELTDGDTTIRFIGFRKEQQQCLHTYCQQEKPINIKNCRIQYNKYNNKLEILLKNDTAIELSDADFTVPYLKTIGSNQIKLQSKTNTTKLQSLQKS